MDDMEREIIAELEHELRDLEQQVASVRLRIAMILKPGPRPKTILFIDPYNANCDET
jgi:hypothetical protein